MGGALFIPFAFSVVLQQRLLLSECSVQTSPDTTFFPSNYLPYLFCMVPCYRLFLIQNLICDFCSSDQRFARGQSVPTSGYLQICSRLQHPCLRLSPSRRRADSELSPVKMCAAGHTKKNSRQNKSVCCFFGYSIFSKLSVCCRVCHGHADRLFWALWVQAYIPGSSPPPRSARRGETGLIFPDHQSAKP